MKPRSSADYRLLFWMFALMPLVTAAVLLRPESSPWLFPASLYFAYCTGIASHCHNHCPVFASRGANRLYSLWLGVFYGFPAFAWVPTHNQNHHRFRDGPGDLTATASHAEVNGLWAALTYPLTSARRQAPAIARHVRRARQRNSAAFVEICAQYVAVVAAHGVALAVAVTLHGGLLGAVAYGLALGLPAAFAMWSMMFTNYLQHVDCNPDSPDHHSRNFVSPALNWFVFNAGYHTVHHEHPGVHWSLYPELHRRRAVNLDPTLNPSSILGYCWQTYVRGAP